VRYRDMMIGWTPKRFERPGRSCVCVDVWPDRRGWSRPYHMTDGACWLESRTWTLDQQKLRIMTLFHTLVVRDRLDVDEVHREFCKIDEYRVTISRDIEGADDGAEESFSGEHQAN
jgi:hypothetical protein